MASTERVSNVHLQQADEKCNIAEFIHDLKEWHDCLFVVGKHEEEIEEISGMKRYLKLHSSVFRKLLTDTNTTIVVCIKDISPDVFKLMLNHMYGGKLPHLDPEMATRLAAAAQLYRVRSLSRKLTKLTKIREPILKEDELPTLTCETNIPSFELDPMVNKVAENKTKINDIQSISHQENMLVSKSTQIEGRSNFKAGLLTSDQLRDFYF